MRNRDDPDGVGPNDIENRNGKMVELILADIRELSHCGKPQRICLDIPERFTNPNFENLRNAVVTFGIKMHQCGEFIKCLRVKLDPDSCRRHTLEVI